MLQVPNFASQINFEKIIKKLIIGFKNYYNNKTHLVESFENLIKALTSYPEIQKKIVEEDFNF